MSRYREVLARLAELIEGGGLAGGDKLPAERDLAQRFGVSRDSVREALRVLAERGVVARRQGDGTYIAAKDTGHLKRVFEEAFAAQKKRLQEIFVFRRILEPAIAGLAAEAVSPEELEKLNALLQKQLSMSNDGRTSTQLDIEFHQMLARCTKNEVLMSALSAANEVLGESRSAHLWSGRRGKVSTDGHQSIIDALQRRDAKAATQAMRAHLDAVEAEALDASEPPFAE